MQMVVRNEGDYRADPTQMSNSLLRRSPEGLPLWRSVSVKKTILRLAKVSDNTLILHDSKLLEST